MSLLITQAPAGIKLGLLVSLSDLLYIPTHAVIEKKILEKSKMSAHGQPPP